MQLTAQQLSDVVAALRGANRSAADVNNKRRFQRLAAQAKVDVTAHSPQISPRAFSALTRDISYGGLGLTQAVLVAADQELLVSLPCGRSGTLLLRCKVAHCATLAYSLFGVGLEFLEQVGSGSQEGAATNRRHEEKAVPAGSPA